MIVLVTDFGLEGPYVGQMQAVLHAAAPGVPVVNLFADLPPHDPRSAAYLLAAYGGPPFAAGTVFLAVVDPGVGTERAPLVVEADGRWFVGPDNGLFGVLIARQRDAASAWRLTWQPDRLSDSFHGRDLFAPAAAALARGERPGSGPVLLAEPVEAHHLVGADWPPICHAVIYVDRFGNALTGIPGGAISRSAVLRVGDRRLHYARTFGMVKPGEAMWYVNSNGLVELACNGARADRVLGVSVGVPVAVEEPGG